jgi:hypothetical protein
VVLSGVLVHILYGIRRDIRAKRTVQVVWVATGSKHFLSQLSAPGKERGLETSFARSDKGVEHARGGDRTGPQSRAQYRSLLPSFMLYPERLLSSLVPPFTDDFDPCGLSRKAFRESGRCKTCHNGRDPARTTPLCYAILSPQPSLCDVGFRSYIRPGFVRSPLQISVPHASLLILKFLSDKLYEPAWTGAST